MPQKEVLDVEAHDTVQQTKILGKSPKKGNVKEKKGIGLVCLGGRDSKINVDDPNDVQK